MKQLTFLTKILFLLLTISFWSSCEEDGTGGGGSGFTLPPVVELQSGAGLVSSPTTVDPGATFMVNVKAEKGDLSMATFTVLEDGIAIDANRLNYNTAGAGALNNPYTLNTGEQSLFDTNIEVTAHTDGGTRTYTFRITDSEGNTDDTNVEITVITTPLAIGLDGSNGGLVANATFPAPSTMTFQLQATKGASQLSTFSVVENDTLVSPWRVRFNTSNDLSTATTATSNPIDLIDDEKNGINWFVWVASHEGGTSTYTFRITDEASESEEVSLEITVESLVELSGKLLFNAAGDTGTGGINLMTGEGTGSSTAGSHLKDSGIDVTMPGSDWIKKIAPINGATLRIPTTDSSVNNFGSVTTAAEIADAFNFGTTTTLTEVVNIGDTFLVQGMDGTIFLVNVTNINETTTSGDNGDYYELAIKY